MTAAAVAAGVGLVSGLAIYLGRSERVEPHTPGTEAWPVHLVAAAVALVWYAVAWRRSPLGWTVILSPLGRPTAARIAATLRAGARPSNLARCLVVAVLVFVELYMAWRIGLQVLLYAACHTLLRWVTVPPA